MAKSYNKGFHTLMAEAGILSAESFSAYINDVVGFNNFQGMDVLGFEWDPDSSLTFDWAQAIMSNRIKVMATYVDKDSEAIPFGTEGFEMLRGVIPCMKARFLWDQDDYRRYLDALGRLQFQNRTVQEYALDLLFNGMSDMKSAHDLSMTYQRDQVVSNRKLELDATNNPRGIKGLVFESDIPEANIHQLTVAEQWFNDNENKTAETANTNADPVGDFKKIIRELKRKGFQDITIEVDYISWLEDMDHPKWRTAFGYVLRPDLYGSGASDTDSRALAVGNNANDEDLKTLFAKVVGVPAANVVLRKGLAGVERLQGSGPDAKLVRQSFRTFNANTYVIYPSGPLGTIKSAVALVPDGEAIYSTFFGGRGLIQYDYDVKAKFQDWWSELYALCVMTRPKEMVYLLTFKEKPGSGSGSGSNGGA